MKRIWKELSNFIELVWQTKRSSLPVLGLSASLKAASPYVSLYFSAQLLNAAIAGNQQDCVKYVVLMLGCLFAINLLERFTGCMMEVLRYDFREGVDQRVAAKLYELEYEKLENSKIVEKIRHMDKQAQSIGEVSYLYICLYYIIMQLFSLLYSLIFVFVLILQSKTVTQNFFISPYSNLLLIALYVAISLLSGKLSRKAEEHWMKMAEMITHDEAINNYLTELMENEKNGKDIRVYRLQDFFISQGIKYGKASVKPRNKVVALRNRCDCAVAVLGQLAALTAYIFIGARAYYGIIGFGDVLMYVGAFNMVSSSMTDLISICGNFLHFSDNLNFYEEFLKQPSMSYDGTLPIEKRDDGEYEFEFHNVSFSYPDTGVEVLHHVNLKFNVGETMALVGRNGAGKTTIVKLLCRLYEPTSGYITLNGIDIRKYKYSEYVKAFSVVFQDFQLLSFALEENVASGENIEEELLQETLKKVNLSERVAQMEQGTKSRLYNNNGAGIDISGGEAQRLAIARALYKDAPFVILDEPTAALDPLAEAEIYENFNQLVKKKTAIYISHRMSSCKFCNRIVVMDQGSVSECGTHEELIQRQGIYAELYNTQAKYYA